MDMNTTTLVKLWVVSHQIAQYMMKEHFALVFADIYGFLRCEEIYIGIFDLKEIYFKQKKAAVQKLE